MKKTAQLFSILLFCLVIFSACVKHGDEVTINSFLTNRSTIGKKWYVRSVYADDAKYLECLNDDVWTFSTNAKNGFKGGFINIQTSFMKCELGDRDRNFEYMLGVNNERLIYVTSEGNYTELFEIVEITQDFLAIEYRESDNYGVKSTLVRYEFQSK